MKFKAVIEAIHQDQLGASVVLGLDRSNLARLAGSGFQLGDKVALEMTDPAVLEDWPLPQPAALEVDGDGGVAC